MFPETPALFLFVYPWSLTLTAKAFLSQKCHPLLWVDSPTPVSVQLCPEAVRDSVNRNLSMCAVELLVPGAYNIKATLNLADGTEMFCLDIYTELA